MSQSKSLAESLFEDLLKESPVKKSDRNDPLKLTQKSKNEKLSKITQINPRTSITPDENPDEDPLSDLVLQNEILMKKLKKCRVRLPKIGQKKILRMIKKSIKKNNKKSNNKRKSNRNNNNDKNGIYNTKQSVIRLSRVDIGLVSARKRKISNSPNHQSSTPKKRNSQTKLLIKSDKQLKTKKVQKKKLFEPQAFTKAHLQEKFGRQYLKCHVRVNKVRSLDNLNVTDLEQDLAKKEKKRLKKKAKGLNKSVSFVETVEVFGESDSDDDNTSELNEKIIELDALLDEKIDGGGGDDGNLTNVDSTLIKKQYITNDDIIENGDANENISITGDDLMASTPKEKLPGKVGRIRKSFSPLKSEEEQKSPRNKLLRKGDEKIVRQVQLMDDDDDEDEKKNDVEITKNKNDISISSRLEFNENKNLKNNEKVKSIEKKSLISDEYESLSSDDINDFIDGKDVEQKINKNDSINKIFDDDEDDDYYLPKSKILQNDQEIIKTTDKKLDNDKNVDDIEIKVNENIIDVKDNCNSNEMDNEVFHNVVESIDMLNSNVTASQSSEQFGEQLKYSEDDVSENLIDKEIKTIENETISSSSSGKFSFNSFLKSSIQTIKTKIMSESPKRLSTDNMTTTTTTTDSTTKTFTYSTEENITDDMPQGLLLDETDDDESSALLGDPVLGGREMSF